MSSDGDERFHGAGILSRRRKDGKRGRWYYVRVKVDGRAFKIRAGNSYQAAMDKRASIKSEIAAGTWRPPGHEPQPVVPEKGPITVSEFAPLFVRLWAHGKRAPRWFAENAARIVADWGEIPLERITTGQIQQWRASLATTHAPEGVNHRVRFFKNMLNRAVEWGHLTTNPAQAVRLMAVPRTADRFLTWEQTDGLIEGAAEYFRPVIRFTLLTGFRAGEVTGLTWDRVDLEKRTIHLLHTKTDDPRTAPIGDELLSLLQGLPSYVTSNRGQRGSVPVFVGYWCYARRCSGGRRAKYGGTSVHKRFGSERCPAPIRDHKVPFRKACSAAGLDGVRFHDLRHTWASRFMMAGGGLYDLMQIGGWRDLESVQRYARFAPDYLQQCANLVSVSRPAKEDGKNVRRGV